MLLIISLHCCNEGTGKAHSVSYFTHILYYTQLCSDLTFSMFQALGQVQPSLSEINIGSSQLEYSLLLSRILLKSKLNFPFPRKAFSSYHWKYLVSVLL